MKRTATGAQLRDETNRSRIDIKMPQDQWGQQMTCQLQCHSDDTVDDAKRKLQWMIWEAHGWNPKLSIHFNFSRKGNMFPTQDQSLT